MMMLAYQRYWLEALFISREAKRLWKEGLLSREQFRLIRSAYMNPLFVPGPAERVTLFLFSWIAIAGLLSLAFEVVPVERIESTAPHLVLVGIACLIVLEGLIKYRKVFRAGVDDAALYAGMSLSLAGVALLLSRSFGVTFYLMIPLLALPVLAAAALRYADRVIAVAAFACMPVLAYQLTGIFGETASTLLVLMVLGYSAAVYFWCRNARRQSRFFPWADCIEAVGVVSLFAFYLTSNAFVVRYLVPASSVAGSDASGFLYALSSVMTLCVPVVYVAGGLALRDRMLLRVGLIVELLSLATIRYYEHSLPLVHVCIILGLTLILLSAAIIQFLRPKRSGFTFHKMPVQLSNGTPVKAIEAVGAVGRAGKFAAQQEAVKAFEERKGRIGGGTSLDW